MRNGTWCEPERFGFGGREKPVSLDRLRETFARVVPRKVTARERQEYLALRPLVLFHLARGEWLAFGTYDEIPYRKLVNAVSRVARASNIIDKLESDDERMGLRTEPPERRLAQLHLFSMKQQPDGEIEFVITVKNSSPRRARCTSSRSLIKETNQHTASYRPAGGERRCSKPWPNACAPSTGFPMKARA